MDPLRKQRIAQGPLRRLVFCTMDLRLKEFSANPVGIENG